MPLTTLFRALADALDGPELIELHARDSLLSAASNATLNSEPTPLAQPFLDAMTAPDAHPVCALIADTPLPWAPPSTSTDPRYLAHYASKAHVELVGPGGLVRSKDVRIGLYGILPQSEYGLRTHPAEETFVMLAGRAFWKRGDAPLHPSRPGRTEPPPVNVAPRHPHNRQRVHVSLRLAWRHFDRPVRISRRTRGLTNPAIR